MWWFPSIGAKFTLTHKVTPCWYSSWYTYCMACQLAEIHTFSPFFYALTTKERFEFVECRQTIEWGAHPTRKGFICFNYFYESLAYMCTWKATIVWKKKLEKKTTRLWILFCDVPTGVQSFTFVQFVNYWERKIVLCCKEQTETNFWH